MLKKVTMAFLVAILVFAIIGCGKEDLTGRWVYTDGEYCAVLELFSDGTGTTDNGSGPDALTWLAENGRIKLDYDLGILGNKTYAYDYTLKKDSLIVINEDGEPLEYKRNLDVSQPKKLDLQESKPELYYAKSLSEIPDEAMDKMQKCAEEDIAKQIEEEAKRMLDGWGEEYVFNLRDMEFIGYYFLSLKDEAANALYGHNVCNCVYKVNLDSASEEFTYFTTVAFLNIQIAEDGTYNCNLESKRHASTFTSYPDPVYCGYKDLKEAFADCVTTYENMYTYETNIQE